MSEGLQTITQTKTHTKTVIGWALVGGAIVAAAGVAAVRKPNLKVTALVIAPPTPTLNATFSVTALVKNAGPKIASENPFEVRLRIDAGADGTWDLTPENKTVNGLGMNATATVAWPYVYAFPSYGSHRVEVCSDMDANGNGVVEEANETDNCKIVSLNLVQPPPADLTVFGIPWVDPGTPTTGISVLISASIKNNGGETAPSTIARLRRDLDSNSVWDEGADIDQIVSSLAGGASTLATWNWLAELPGGTTGTRLFRVCTDATGAVSEPDEANNCKNFAVYVGPTPAPPSPTFPDFRADMPSMVPATPAIGTMVNLYGYVRNSGTADAPATVARLQRDIGNDGSWDQLANLDLPVGALAAPNGGQLITWTNAWEVMTTGAHRFRVCTDVTSVVIESNEGNNCSNPLSIYIPGN